LEQQRIAAASGFLLIPSLVWLGVRRWRAYQRDKAGAAFRGMIGTVLGFFCLTLLQYNWSRQNQGMLGWDTAVPVNLAVALSYGILLAVVLHHGRSAIAPIGKRTGPGGSV